MVESSANRSKAPIKFKVEAVLVEDADGIVKWGRSERPKLSSVWGRGQILVSFRSDIRATAAQNVLLDGALVLMVELSPLERNVCDCDEIGIHGGAQL